MKKLQLDLDTLAVESFSTDGGEAPRGTVAAHEYTNTAPTCVYHCTWVGNTCEGNTCGCGTEQCTLVSTCRC